MLSNPCNALIKRCPAITRRLIVVPVATLGILGFLINTQLQIIPLNSAICHPKTNIVFLKTHKCAGSSIQNILMRYGYTNNLNFVLPRSGNYLGHPVPFNRTMVGPGRSFHILAHHTRLNYAEIRAIMPRNSIYITVIRNPTQVFESLFYYYSFDKLMDCDIHKFIESMLSYSKEFLTKRFKRKYGANQMFFDLGGDPESFFNDTLMVKYIDELEYWFDLVLIAERMDESLILLRHLLCWEMDDVVTFKLNARHPMFKSNLTAAEQTSLLKLNRADQLLYDRFYKKHEEQVRAFGQNRMDAEVAELRRVTQNWYHLCVMGESPFKKGFKPTKHYVNPRVLKIETNKNVTNSSCNTMTMEELVFTDLIRKRQMLKYPLSFNRIKYLQRPVNSRLRKSKLKKNII
ncbi:galactosylceramide sulfotransferase [Parasteatoda tepidariorum]|uniref:galactosylceramide sulfotransferase n=1 Tax=Parasteatoda tepidariorum TaxID=114398 RepID=UPI001C71AE0C|nr:galactosylceramide sulfotransferase [Parasteatoda tepidariorum]